MPPHCMAVCPQGRRRVLEGNGCGSAYAWAAASPIGARICASPVPRSNFTMSHLARALLPQAGWLGRAVAGASSEARTALAGEGARDRAPGALEFGPKR